MHKKNTKSIHIIVLCKRSLFISLAFLVAQLLTPKDLSAQETNFNNSDVEALLSAGRYVESLEPLGQKLEAATREGNSANIAKFSHDLGVAHLGVNELAQAEHYLVEAAAIAENADMSALASSALNNLGTLHARRLDGQERAREVYRRSIVLAEEGGHLDLAFDALTNQVRLELDLARYAEAIALLDRAAAHLAAKREFDTITGDVLLLGRLFARAGATERGFLALSEARERARDEAEPRLEALATGYLADLYAHEDREEDAVRLYAEATFLAQAAEASDQTYRWQWRMGQITAASGNVDLAIQHYQAAVAELEQLRPTLLEARSSASPTEGIDLRVVYVELADLMLRRAAGGASADARQRDLEAARQAVERYRATELTDYFQDECVANLLASVKPIDRLEPRTAVLYPIMMAERLVILLSLPEGLQQRSLPIGAETLSQEILTFRNLLEKRTTNEFLKPAQDLYDLLLRPLEPTLSVAEIDTLVIVPDEALRTIPLGALHDGRQFVIDRYALATVPSLRLIEPKPLARFNLQPLLTGLSEPVQGFPALPYVENELTAIAELIGGDVLRNRAFSRGRVEQSLSATSHSVVHIASHATFESDSSGSFILTYDGRLDMDNLEQFIKLSRFRDQPVELLTLSACQTAAGDDRAALGLAGLAVKSGARSALASLWYINDRASSLLLADFYEQLRDQPGISKARALQRAQIATKEDLRYRHPAYWSPFILIGNWL